MKFKVISPQKKAAYTIASVSLMLISISILGWLLYQQWDVLVNYEWSFSWEAVLASFILFSLDLFIVALVWSWIMNTIGGKVELKKHLRYYYLSHLARRLPGTVWYIVGRAYLYKQDGVTPKVTSVASGIELIIATMAGIIISLLFTISVLSRYQISPLILVAAFLLGSIITHPRSVRWILYRLGKDEQIQMFGYAHILQWLLAYGLVWAIGGITLYAIGNIITIIDIKYLPYLIGSWSAVGVISALVFFAPSKLGIVEVSLSLLLATVIPAPVAIVFAIVTRMLLFIYEIIWAIIVYFWP